MAVTDDVPVHTTARQLREQLARHLSPNLLPAPRPVSDLAERRRCDILLSCLPARRFARALEVGGDTPALTRELAGRCDCLEVVDPGRASSQWPDGAFDLVVISDVGSRCRDLRTLKHRVQAALAPDGVLVVCHPRQALANSSGWLDPSERSHPAELVHAVLAQRLYPVVRHVEPQFLLEVFARDATIGVTQDGPPGTAWNETPTRLI